MQSTKAFFIIIWILVALSQFATDLYLPSLPIIAQDLSASINQVQLSISVYMYGLALAQLIYGPLSDGIGRKKPVMIGLVTF